MADNREEGLREARGSSHTSISVGCETEPLAPSSSYAWRLWGSREKRRVVPFLLIIALACLMFVDEMFLVSKIGVPANSGKFVWRATQVSVPMLFEQLTSSANLDETKRFVAEAQRFRTALLTELNRGLTKHLVIDKAFIKLDVFSWDPADLEPYRRFHLYMLEKVLSTAQLPRNFYATMELASRLVDAHPSRHVNRSRRCISELVGDETAQCFGLPRSPARRTCAVVGSGRILLDGEHGVEIDRHSLVIRFNQAPTETFKEFAGSRTDIRIIHDPKAVLLALAGSSMPPQQDDEIRLIRLFPNIAVVDFYDKVQGVAAILQPNSTLSHNVFFVSPILEHAAFRLQRYSIDDATQRCSAGLIGTLLALTICDEVDLYGFHSDDYRLVQKRGSNAPLLSGGRYFDTSSTAYPSPHSWNREQHILELLELHGLLQIHL